MRYILLIILLTSVAAKSQNTVGLIHYSQEAYEGYNLIYPHNQSTVFLFNNCGEIVHSWADDAIFFPGNSVYLLENGNLVKTKRSTGPGDAIWAGGGGAIVEIRSWENELLHSYELNDSLFRLHHDVAPLPNGNILLLAWSKKTKQEALDAGRDPSTMADEELWQEVILEWNPTLDSIVWEWNVWDHLIQDYDFEKENFGIVGDHPELIDINYDEHDGHRDWLHINAINYNPVLDQIALSVPYFNELWVIDHSSTREEAVGHTGGNSGKGGDLLFRWGNPATYRQGNISNKRLFFQHDVHWIAPYADPEDEDYGVLGLFNNRVADDFSTVNLIKPILTDNDPYQMDQSRFLPTDFLATYTHPTKTIQAFSNSVSSAQFLPNGNVLICAGRFGYSYELNPENQVVWTYITPLQAGMPAEQGSILSIGNNLTFRLERYPVDFPAFENRDLSPKGYIESNPNEGACLEVDTDEVFHESAIKIYPNPASQQLSIEQNEFEFQTISLYNLQGQLIKRFSLSANITTVRIDDVSPGMYILKGDKLFVQKLVIQ